MLVNLIALYCFPILYIIILIRCMSLTFSQTGVIHTSVQVITKLEHTKVNKRTLCGYWIALHCTSVPAIVSTLLLLTQ